ncbi:aldehyde dehydrogenase family protein, partial [Pseudomonas sp. SIMBA_065]
MPTHKLAAPALRRPDLLRQAAYVGGTWVEADDAVAIDVRNPASGNVIGCVPDLDVEMVRKGIDQAATALESWRRTTAKHRSLLLRAWHD